MGGDERVSGAARGPRSAAEKVAARVEALTQQVPGHELADVRFDRRAVVGPRSARALVIVAAVVVALVGGVMLLGRLSGGGDGPGDPAVMALSPVGEVAASATAATSAGSAGPAVEAGGTSAAPVSGDAEVVVSVQGMVARAGLITVGEGTRVGELADLAGGTSPEARLDGVNLAERVVDGMQLVVDGEGSRVEYPGGTSGQDGSRGGEPSGAAGAAGAAGTAGAATDGAVNLNTADATALGTLTGVGPKTAEAIIAWRDANGPFASVEQLMEVKGIGPTKFEALRDSVTV
jgi:competence protein ComEA